MLTFPARPSWLPICLRFQTRRSSFRISKTRGSGACAAAEKRAFFDPMDRKWEAQKLSEGSQGLDSLQRFLHLTPREAMPAEYGYMSLSRVLISLEAFKTYMPLTLAVSMARWKYQKSFRAFISPPGRPFKWVAQSRTSLLVSHLKVYLLYHMLNPDFTSCEF